MTVENVSQLSPTKRRKTMNHSISGKAAIVTGASSGIGRAIARLFAAEGAKLALAARSIDKLRTLANEIGGLRLSFQLTLHGKAMSSAWRRRPSLDSAASTC